MTVPALSANITAAQDRIVVDTAVLGLTADSILRLESEQLRLVSYAPDLTSSIPHTILNVERGVNGTTAATHASTTPLIVGPVIGLTTVSILEGSGAPTDGGSGTGVGFAAGGSIYIRNAAGNIAAYINTGTAASPAWKAITHA
jgi:hypothetical protein